MSHAVHTVVLSLAGLRRIRFQNLATGATIATASRDETETAARTALAALALAGIVYQRRQGYDLRSRSLLLATEPLVFEILGHDGRPPQQFVIQDAATLLAEAVAAAGALGMGWDGEPIALKPAPKLAHLIRKSRELTAAGEAEDAG